MMKAKTVLTLVIATAALATQAFAQSSDAPPTASPPAATSGKATTSDQKLARDVRKALSKAQGFNVSNVFVKARGGAVTLSGSVPEGEQIQQATEVAKGVAGVTSVTNRLSLYSRGY